MPKVKCKYCGKSIDKESAFIEEYLTDSLSIRYKYFCSKECFDKKNEEIVRKQWLKRVRKLAREKARELCGLSEKEKSIYFSSTYKIITDKFEDELIYEFLCEYETEIREILDGKDFKTSASRIKYFCCLVENQLERYLLEKEESKKEEETKEIEVDDFDIVVNVEKKEKRGIDEILGL